MKKILVLIITLSLLSGMNTFADFGVMPIGIVISDETDELLLVEEKEDNGIRAKSPTIRNRRFLLSIHSPWVRFRITYMDQNYLYIVFLGISAYQYFIIRSNTISVTLPG